jgi:hypothetical protein
MKQLVEVAVNHYDQTNKSAAPVEKLKQQLVKFARAYANYLQHEVSNFKIAARNEKPPGNKAKFMKDLNEESEQKKQNLVNRGEVDDGKAIDFALTSIKNRKIAEHLGLDRDSYAMTLIGHMKNMVASIKMSSETNPKKIIQINQEEKIEAQQDYRAIAATFTKFKDVINKFDNPDDIETEKDPQIIGTYLPMVDGKCLDEYLFLAPLDEKDEEESLEKCNEKRASYSYGLGRN